MIEEIKREIEDGDLLVENEYVASGNKFISPHSHFLSAIAKCLLYFVEEAEQKKSGKINTHENHQ